MLKSKLKSVLLLMSLFGFTHGQVIPGGQNVPTIGRFGPGPQTPFLTGSIVHGTCYFNDTYSPVKGRVDLRQDLAVAPPIIQIRVQVLGLPQSTMSDQEHAIHVHQWGDTGRNCYNAGPHFDSDPFSVHGGPNSLDSEYSKGVAQPIACHLTYWLLAKHRMLENEILFLYRASRHDGDFGNLRQTNDGVIDTSFNVQNMVLAGDAGILGRSVVLHESRDDLGLGGTPASLRNGNSGPPIACCVIALADSTNWDNPLFINGQFPNAGLNPLNPVLG